MQIVNSHNDNKPQFLPLRDVRIHVEIKESIALIKLTQEYLNPCEKDDCDEHMPDP